ncbi:alternative ribosome rescue aminoacyl-tRNA hydrolase ArfB [Winogradskyella alexanderae]|uniref:Aminoacyl-tRNA hydrolase n=1 Tax=Winogradskyella alexanderae TaxID=2877123 RepID=A0ABS7XR37_9FLAO|nr:alternative ribosome rescue aminoacyl-tRNA hydrolase ArfB [Winogradskyella alexanderae]MCA0131511.1 aminoacyl-tRNA hydrolase [Winogradskyella alexanderae]
MNEKGLISELTFNAIRSSGSGGQHVNKVATKIVLFFDLNNSSFLDENDKRRLHSFLSNRINKEGILILSSGQSRSQLKNKTLVTRRFISLIKQGLKEEKQRKKTKVPLSIKRKRLETKRRVSEKKANRKPPRLN